MEKDKKEISWKDILTGLIIGGVLSFGSTYFTISNRLIKLEIEVNNISEDFENLNSQLIDVESNSNSKPANISYDQWYLFEGIRLFTGSNYQLALVNFKRIQDLAGHDFIKWKYYEGLTRFKIMQYEKYRKLVTSDPDYVDTTLYIFSELKKISGESYLHNDILYWYAQTLYHFKQDYSASYKSFSEIKGNTKMFKGNYYNWREGTMYYMAMCLINEGGESNIQEGINQLKDLLVRYPSGLLKIIEKNEDKVVVYIVELNPAEAG